MLSHGILNEQMVWFDEHDKFNVIWCDTYVAHMDDDGACVCVEEAN